MEWVGQNAIVFLEINRNAISIDWGFQYWNDVYHGFYNTGKIKKIIAKCFWFVANMPLRG